MSPQAPQRAAWPAGRSLSRDVARLLRGALHRAAGPAGHRAFRDRMRR